MGLVDAERFHGTGVEERSISASSRSRPKIPSAPPPLRREDPTIGWRSCDQELVQRCREQSRITI